jgi:hypothetical protein
MVRASRAFCDNPLDCGVSHDDATTRQAIDAKAASVLERRAGAGGATAKDIAGDALPQNVGWLGYACLASNSARSRVCRLVRAMAATPALVRITIRDYHQVATQLPPQECRLTLA